MNLEQRIEALKKGLRTGNRFLIDNVISDMEHELQGRLLADRPANVIPHEWLQRAAKLKETDPAAYEALGSKNDRV